MSSIPKTPISIDSEKALLGSLIIDSESWEKISNLIIPTDFYDEKLKLVNCEELMTVQGINEKIALEILKKLRDD